MKRKLTSILLMSALLVGGASTFVSCKDYDGDQAAVTNANVKGLSDKLNEQIAALEAVKGDLAKKADKTYVDDLIADIDETIADLTDVVNGHTEKLIEVEAAIVDIDGRLGNLEDFEGQVKSLFGKDLENVLLKGSLAKYASGELGEEYAKDFLAAMVASLNNAIAAAGTEQFTNVEELFKYLDKTIPAKLKNLSDSCAMIAGRDSLLNSRIDSLVTNVNVDMVSNPIYGTFNTPFGVKNYVLAGFVGAQIEGQEFAGQDIEGGLASSIDGGNIYLTINPAEADVTGWNIGKLVGRDGSYAPGFESFVLGPDDTPVTTVSTRASNGLGGYVAAAKFEDASKAKINIDKDALKEVAKNVLGKLRGQEALDITQNVYTIYNQFANAIDQYYAVKVEVKYNDIVTGKVKTRTIVSDYNIAAFAIKPLAFTTNIGVVGEKVNIPSIPAFENLLGIEIKDVKINPVTANIDDFTFTVVDNQYTDNDYKVKVVKEADGTGTIDMPLWNEGQRYVVPFTSCEAEDVYNSGVKVAIKYTVHIAQDANKIINDLNDQLASVEGQVNTTLNSVKDAIAKAGKYYNKVAPKLNKVISKVNYVLDNANQLLQPIMLGVADGEAFRLSEVEAAPTVVKANGENAIVLAPTSYTLELLAPAYKKSIKVNKKELNATLDGATKTVVASLISGLNTIEYEVMDFYGNKVAKKYYIEVK